MYISIFVVFKGVSHHYRFLNFLSRCSYDFSHGYYNIVTNENIKAHDLRTNPKIIKLDEQYLETRIFINVKSIDELKTILDKTTTDIAGPYLRSTDVHIYKEYPKFID